VGEGLKRAGHSLRQSAAPRFVDALLDQGRDTALAEAPLDTRLKAIQVLAYDDFERVREALTILLAPKQPQEIQRAAVMALGSFSQPEVAKLLLSGWRTYTPAIRSDVINALLDARSRIHALLDAIEGGLVPANQVPFAPNREVAPNFLSYTIETKDGRTLDGIIADESAASLTLKRAEGVTETVLRRDIAQISGSGLSLMPEGVETAVSIEQMADLIAFLLPPPSPHSNEDHRHCAWTAQGHGTVNEANEKR